MNTHDDLLLKYDKRVRQLARMYYVPGYDTDDLEQEFRMLLLKCGNNYKPEIGAAFETYFITSCKNKVKSLQRDLKREKRPKVEFSLNEEDYRGVPLIDSITYTVEADSATLALILDELDKLPNKEITIDYYLNGMTLQEISNKTDLSLSMVYRLNNENVETLKKVFNSGV